MKKFVPPSKPKKIKVGSLAKKEAANRRKIETIREDKDLIDELDLLEAITDKNTIKKPVPEVNSGRKG